MLALFAFERCGALGFYVCLHSVYGGTGFHGLRIPTTIMAFHSFAYLLFLPCVFLIYWSLKRSYRLQNTVLLAASYVFYGWWDARMLLLIAFTTLSSYACAVAMEHYDRRPAVRAAFNVTNIVVSLGILGVFKYYDFFALSFAQMCSVLGFETHPVLLHLLLPVGISFYTFQAVGYTIDVYRRDLSATRDVLAYAVFISFFPQLVAGPIERAARMLPVFTSARVFRYGNAVEGLRRILWGLFKKMVIADNCAQVVNPVFSGWSEAGNLALLIGCVLFTIQIYCDFSGYSDIAVGSAKLFGIELQENFRAPYFARSISDFWRRWHLSLTSWFRDYVYIPLGGNRRGAWKTWRNTFIVFLLSGLWHGAAYTFVCWGLFHALLFVPFRYMERVRLPLCVRRIITFVCVAVGWVVFRSESMADAFGYLKRMCIPETLGQMFRMPSGLTAMAVAVAASLVMFSAEWRTLPDGRATDCFGRMTLLRRRIVYLLLAAAVLVLGGEAETFIYFQF